MLPRGTNCLNHLGSPETIKERMKKYHGCPYVVGLDIFPLDYVPASEDERDLQVNRDCRFPAKAFTNIIMQPFEFTEIPVPLGYHEFLTAYYGDYMVKINEPSSHEYPFYRSQKAVLEQAGIFIDYDHMNIL